MADKLTELSKALVLPNGRLAEMQLVPRPDGYIGKGS